MPGGCCCAGRSSRMARGRMLAALHAGELSRAALLRDLTGSAEFARVVLLDDAVAFAAGSRRAPGSSRVFPRPVS